MVTAWSIYSAGGALPYPGGLCDQDIEVVAAFSVLAQFFGGLQAHLAMRNTVRLG